MLSAGIMEFKGVIAIAACHGYRRRAGDQMIVPVPANDFFRSHRSNPGRYRALQRFLAHINDDVPGRRVIQGILAFISEECRSAVESAAAMM